MDGTAVYSTNTAELLFYAAIPVLLYCCCPVVFVGSRFCCLVGKCLQDNVVTVLLLPGRELWLGYDPSTRRPRHDERKYDEIVSSLRIELSAFIRITFRTYINTAVQQYGSTK